MAEINQHCKNLKKLIIEKNTVFSVHPSATHLSIQESTCMEALELSVPIHRLFSVLPLIGGHIKM